MYITSVAHHHAMFNSSWIIRFTTTPVSVLELWSITPKPDIILKNMNIVISICWYLVWFSFILKVNSVRQCLNTVCIKLNWVKLLLAFVGVAKQHLQKQTTKHNKSDKIQQFKINTYRLFIINNNYNLVLTRNWLNWYIRGKVSYLSCIMTTNPGSGDAISMFFHKGSQEFLSGATMYRCKVSSKIKTLCLRIRS